MGRTTYLGARSRTGSTGCKNTSAFFCSCNFLSACRHARKSLMFMPLACALGTALALGAADTFVGLATDKSPRLLTAGCGVLGVGAAETSTCKLLERSLSLGGNAGSELLVVGAVDFEAREGLLGSLTGGSGGATSDTGVGGRWRRTFGDASSAPRMRRSASLSRHQRTSQSVSEAL